MAQQHQLVGIIELDIASELDATLDENIGQTLRRLRSGADRATQQIGPSDAVDYSFPCSESHWDSIAGARSDSVVVLTADLRQLHSDLETELARLLDRLLAIS